MKLFLFFAPGSRRGRIQGLNLGTLKTDEAACRACICLLISDIVLGWDRGGLPSKRLEVLHVYPIRRFNAGKASRDGLPTSK